MSYNVDDTFTLKTTLCIHQDNLDAARQLRLPERNPLDGMSDPDEQGVRTLPLFQWSGVGSGYMHDDGTLATFVSLTSGDADVVLVWEGGASFTSLRIRDGKVSSGSVKFSIQGPFRHLVER